MFLGEGLAEADRLELGTQTDGRRLGQQEDGVDAGEAGEEEEVRELVVLVTHDRAQRRFTRGTSAVAEARVEVVGRLVHPVAGRKQVDRAKKGEAKRPPRSL